MFSQIFNLFYLFLDDGSKVVRQGRFVKGHFVSIVKIRLGLFRDRSFLRGLLAALSRLMLPGRTLLLLLTVLISKLHIEVLLLPTLLFLLGKERLADVRDLLAL